MPKNHASVITNSVIAAVADIVDMFIRKGITTDLRAYVEELVSEALNEAVTDALREERERREAL